MHSVLCGLDRIEEAAPLLKGRRVGLMTNQTGISSRFESAIDILYRRFHLAALFAVEHGIRGDVQAGEHYETRPDPETGVPVYAVYGKTHRLTDEMLAAFDVLLVMLVAKVYEHIILHTGNRLKLGDMLKMSK